MGRAEAIAKLKEHEAELKRLGIEHLFSFGSTARDEGREDSDLDLFFDHPLASLTLFQTMNMQAKAAEILGTKADVMTRRRIHPRLCELIESSAEQIF